MYLPSSLYEAKASKVGKMYYIRYAIHTHLVTLIEKRLEAGGWIDTEIAITWQ